MAAGGEMEFREASDLDKMQIMAMAEGMRCGLLAVIGDDADDPNVLAKAIVAAATVAGTIFGTLIIAGVAKDQDKRRATANVARNFREGIEVGKRRGLRIAAEQFGGRA